MSTQTLIDLSCKDFLLLFLGFILSGFWPFILYLLKPSLEIVSFSKEKDKFKLKVIKNNNSKSIKNLNFCSIIIIGIIIQNSDTISYKL